MKKSWRRKKNQKSPGKKALNQPPQSSLGDVDAAEKESSHRGEKGGRKIGLKLKKKKWLKIEKKTRQSGGCTS